jgi:hypothetical protein
MPLGAAVGGSLELGRNIEIWLKTRKYVVVLLSDLTVY